MSVPYINCYNYLLFTFKHDSADASALAANHSSHRIKTNLAEFTKQTKQTTRKNTASMAKLLYLKRNIIVVNVTVS